MSIHQSPFQSAAVQGAIAGGKSVIACLTDELIEVSANLGEATAQLEATKAAREALQPDLDRLQDFIDCYGDPDAEKNEDLRKCLDEARECRDNPTED